MRKIALLVAALAMVSLVTPASAQSDYPNRPIKIFVTIPPGVDLHGVDARVARNAFRQPPTNPGLPAVGEARLADERAAQGNEVDLAAADGRFQPLDIPVAAHQDHRDGQIEAFCVG